MKLSRPRYAHIERLVGDLLDRASVGQVPVPVERMIHAQGCGIRYSDLKDVFGVLVRAQGTAVIGVNSKHPETRRRFTLAHEFGHMILHEGKEVWYDRDFRVDLRSDASSLGADVDEIEANFFAASLLMPDRFLDVDSRTASIDMEDAASVKDLARSYAVSAQAMSLRLARLFGRRSTAAARPR